VHCNFGKELRVLTNWRALARQLAQKFALVHAVLEGLVPIDEHDWDFVIKFPSQFVVAIHIHILPGKPAAAGELGETFFH
jgi:hypothetical protein